MQITCVQFVVGLNIKECIQQLDFMDEEVIEIVDEKVLPLVLNVLGEFKLHL